jgi:F0F1-type ATP synthase assembly protein I
MNQNKKAMAIAFALGFELLTLVLAGIFLGYYLGGYAQLQNIGAVLGCSLAFFIWIWRLIKTKRYLL